METHLPLEASQPASHSPASYSYFLVSAFINAETIGSIGADTSWNKRNPMTIGCVSFEMEVGKQNDENRAGLFMNKVNAERVRNRWI